MLLTFFPGTSGRRWFFGWWGRLSSSTARKARQKMAREEAIDERKRNLLSSLMHIAELEDQELREFDTVDLRRQPPWAIRGWRGKGERRSVSGFMFCHPITGRMQRVCLQLIIWWLDYIENPEPNCPFWNKMFWQRFRLPYLSYPQILEWVSGNDCDGLFNRWWTEADGFNGRKKH